jgi:hypothetical protein
MNRVVGNNCRIVKFAREPVERKLGETVAMQGSIGERIPLRLEAVNVNWCRYAAAARK